MVCDPPLLWADIARSRAWFPCGQNRPFWGGNHVLYFTAQALVGDSVIAAITVPRARTLGSFGDLVNTTYRLVVNRASAVHFVIGETYILVGAQPPQWQDEQWTIDLPNFTKISGIARLPGLKSATTTKLDDAGDYDAARGESDHTPPQLSHFSNTSVADVPLFQVVGLGLGSALSGSRHAAVETSGCLAHPQLSVNTCPNLPVITSRSDQALQEGRSDDAWLGLPGCLGLLGVQGCPARVSSDDDSSWRDAVAQRVEQSIRVEKAELVFAVGEDQNHRASPTRVAHSQYATLVPAGGEQQDAKGHIRQVAASRVPFVGFGFGCLEGLFACVGAAKHALCRGATVCGSSVTNHMLPSSCAGLAQQYDRTYRLQCGSAVQTQQVHCASIVSETYQLSHARESQPPVLDC